MAQRTEAEEPVYVISVAAKLLEIHPQTLRLYERLGLVVPARSRSKHRLYSHSNVERVRRIQHLTQDMGVNLAGVEVILDLLDRMERQRREVRRRMLEIRRELQERIAHMREDLRREMEQEAAVKG